MEQEGKRQLIIIAINTAVIAAIFLIKFILLPLIPGTDFNNATDEYFFMTWVPVPLFSIIALIIERQVRLLIIPDFVYCALTFAISGQDWCPFDTGMYGGLYPYYSRDIALIDRCITFVLMLVMQLIIKGIIVLVI